MLKLDGIKALVDRLSATIGAPADLLPTYGQSRNGHPHIEVDKSYHYVIVERGAVQQHMRTKDIDQLLYWIFSNVTVAMASSSAAKLRVQNTDSRRVWFPKQIELMEKLEAGWGRRMAAEQEMILRDYTFRDGT